MAASSFYDDLRNDPASFLSQLGVPQPASFPTFRTVSEESRGLSSKILTNWTTLNAILDRHEEVLRKRWLKRTREQRKKVLLTAWPDMPAMHRPDFFALTKETPQQRSAITKFRGSFLYPEINLVDLVQGKSLLLLLNSRGRHRPEAFAHADANATHVGHTSAAIRPAFLNECTMLLSGQSKAKYYGQLVSWEDHDKAFEWMISGFEFQPGMGLLVLERQQKILDFLVKCCHLLLQDMTASSLINESVPIQPEPSPILVNEIAYQSVTAVTAEAPYRVPAHLDLQRLRSLISARRSAAEDHVWALREDPSYFAEIVKDVGDHRQETLLDVNGRQHPVLKEDVFWERVLGTVVVTAYGNLSLWDKIYEQIAALATLHQKYAGVISPERPLSEKLEKSFHTLRYLVNQASDRPISELKVAVPPSPPMRSLFVRRPPLDPNSTIIQVMRKPNKGDDVLLGFLLMLWDEHQVFLCGLDNIVEVIERLVQEDPKQKGRFSALVAGIFSDLALLAETLHQINLYQPWASMFEHNAVGDEETIKAECAKTLSIFTDIAKDLKGVKSLAALGAPFQNRFYYPVQKRRTKQITEAMRKAEHVLDAFWRNIDLHFKSTGSLRESIRRLLSQNHQLQRTPEWVEPVRDRSKDMLTAASDDSPLYIPFSQPEMESGQPSKGQDLSDYQAIRQKTKTRGVPQADEPTTTEIPQRLLPDNQPTIAVSKRALKVFSTIFFVPSHTDQEGHIPWSDFLHAMVSAGFVPEKLYGSVWQFTPTKLDVERSIHFHEPHPAGKIPYYTARRHGRRLNRAYGWTSDMFVLAEQGHEE